MVDILQECLQMGLCLLACLLAMHVHLFAFRGLQEALCPRVLGGVTRDGYTDLDAHTLKPFHLRKTALLSATVSMVDQPGGYLVASPKPSKAAWSGKLLAILRERLQPRHVREYASKTQARETKPSGKCTYVRSATQH